MLHVVTTVILSIPALAQQAPEAACDSTNIEWVLPGEFETARRRAAGEKRILLVKGVSFGIDALGAKCATKGKW